MTVTVFLLVWGYVFAGLCFAWGYRAGRRDSLYVFRRKVSAVAAELDRRSLVRATRRGGGD